MPVLNREQIVDVDDLKRELVKVPEWGGDVYVREMPGVDRDAFEIEVSKSDGDRRENFRAMIAAWTVVDEKGQRLFSANDAELLGGKSGNALNRIFEVAIRLNRMSQKDVEELAGN